MGKGQTDKDRKKWGRGKSKSERDSQRQHHSAVVNSKAVQGIVLNTVRQTERERQRQHHSAVINSKAVPGTILNTVRQTDTDSITQQS